MILKDDTISDLKSPDDLFHLFELLGDGSNPCVLSILAKLYIKKKRL